MTSLTLERGRLEAKEGLERQEIRLYSDYPSGGGACDGNRIG